jgi:hypothetical protein
MSLPRHLVAIVDDLLAASSRSGRTRVTLDELGTAIGSRAVSQDEIDAMIEALASAGHDVGGESTGKATDHLRSVLATARALAPGLGRNPSPAEIAEHAGISIDAVRHALALAKVMQR